MAFLLGAGFLASGVRLVLTPTRTGARRLLFASLIYLPVLLLVMALDRVPSMNEQIYGTAGRN